MRTTQIKPLNSTSPTQAHTSKYGSQEHMRAELMRFTSQFTCLIPYTTLESKPTMTLYSRMQYIASKFKQATHLIIPMPEVCKRSPYYSLLFIFLADNRYYIKVRFGSICSPSGIVLVHTQAAHAYVVVAWLWSCANIPYNRILERVCEPTSLH